eukprot:941928_1
MHQLLIRKLIRKSLTYCQNHNTPCTTYSGSMATNKDKTQQEWQSQLDEITRENQSLKRDIVSLKGENEALKQKTGNKHSESFWREIRWKCEQNDIQYIKSLIDTKTLSVNDVDDEGYSLLHYAACNGVYEVVQLCISLGADVTIKNEEGCTALDDANSMGHH